MTMQEEKSINIELKIPSEFGYEKIAMSTVASIAGEFGFSADKIEDIKTALSEACINAIEHGNQLSEDKNVIVAFRVAKDALIIDVIDEGMSKGFKVEHTPDIKEKLAGEIETRGWGLFLIERLVDDVKVVNETGDASQLRMIIKFEQKKEK
ncbi:ATP-binding protein [Thermodesulfobacteriota bacterium]